ncbi:MAG TPA: prepilin-type N-terminal cleavage/methylation domain-containing protein [Chthoniobacterales bacterium]
MKLRSRSGFTLIELLVTIAIIGMLATLFIPSLKGVLTKAQSAKCAGNLRAIAGAVQACALDNDNYYPEIEAMPSNPVYQGRQVNALLAVLGPYGLQEAALKCPADMARTTSYFKKEGSSYMWRPLVDTELVNATKIYRRGREMVVPSSRAPLASDFTAVHGGRVNVVFADGHVRMF